MGFLSQHSRLCAFYALFKYFFEYVDKFLKGGIKIKKGYFEEFIYEKGQKTLYLLGGILVGIIISCIIAILLTACVTYIKIPRKYEAEEDTGIVATVTYIL